MGLREFLKRVKFLHEQGDQLHFPYVRWILTIVFALAGLIPLIGVVLIRMGTGSSDGGWDSLLIIFFAVGGVLFIELALAIPISLYIGYRINSSIFGPFPRMKRTIHAIGEGDFSQRIKLRDDDVLGGIADAISEMAENLEKRSRQ